jgi:flavin-dependent dehydrogenase
VVIVNQLPDRADVVILGGGPAGLAAGIALRQKGMDCLVVEALGPVIDKGCGEGLMPDALESLNCLGIEIAESEGHVFRGIRFCNDVHCVDAVFPTGRGIGVRRTKLHQRMIERAAEVGVRFAWNARAKLLDRSSLLIDGTKTRFHWLIGADGQSSSVRRWAGLNRLRREQLRFGFRRHYQVAPWSEYVEVHWGRTGQVYITPVADDCVCVAFITRDQHSDRAGFLAEFPVVAAKVKGAPLLSRERGAISATRKLRNVGQDVVALVGDASGSVDAITGEGLALSFRQALALADAIASGDLSAYRKAHRSLARLPQAMAQLMLTMDRWPALERRGLSVLAAKPDFFQELLAIHVGEGSLPRFAASRGVSMAWHLLRRPAY